MALNHGKAILACRALLDTLEVCTVTDSISATTTGYARASGSFVTDGFRVGMEITPTSFTSTDNQVIKSINTAGNQITIDGAITADAAATRTLTAGLPEYRAYRNMEFKPSQAAGRPYTEEGWIRGVKNVTGVGAGGTMIHEPTYVIKHYGLSGKGDAAMDAFTDAVMLLFKPLTTITMSDGTVLRVAERPGPEASEITNPPDKPGRALVTIRIPLWAQTQNA